MRFVQELKAGVNADCQDAVQVVEKVKTQNPKTSYADLFQLGAVVAIKVSPNTSFADLLQLGVVVVDKVNLESKP